MTEPNDLQRWINRQRLDIHADPDSDDSRTICRLDLVHTIDGEGFEKLEMVRVTDDSETAELASILYNAAVHDSETRTNGSVQRYAVLAFRNAEAREHESAYPFTIRTNVSKDLLGSGTEPPTDKGILSHYMRHDENMHRLMMGTNEALFGRMAQELQRETNRRTAAEATLLTVREHEQELLDRKLERDLRMAREVHNAKFLAELAGLVTSMAPMIVAKVLAGDNKTIAQAAPMGRDLAIQKFLKTLDQKKVMGIMQLLEPTQQMSLMEIYKSYAEDDAKEQAQRPEILRDGNEEKEEVH